MGQTRKEKLLSRLQARLKPDGKPKNEYRESVAKIRAELAMFDTNVENNDAGSSHAG